MSRPAFTGEIAPSSSSLSENVKVNRTDIKAKTQKIARAGRSPVFHSALRKPPFDLGGPVVVEIVEVTENRPAHREGENRVQRQKRYFYRNKIAGRQESGQCHHDDRHGGACDDGSRKRQPKPGSACKQRGLHDIDECLVDPGQSFYDSLSLSKGVANSLAILLHFCSVPKWLPSAGGRNSESSETRSLGLHDPIKHHRTPAPESLSGSTAFNRLRRWRDYANVTDCPSSALLRTEMCPSPRSKR